MSVIKINGVDFSPSTLEYQRYDIESSDGSGMNADAETIRERIAVKVKLACTFPPMHDHQISSLLQAVDPLFFELEYPDAFIGSRKKIQAYVSDRSMPLYMFDDSQKEWLWEGISMTFIEK